MRPRNRLGGEGGADDLDGPVVGGPADLDLAGLQPDVSTLERTTLEGAVARARQRLWSADTAAYYAHRRFVESGRAEDRGLYRARQKDQEAAHAALRDAESAFSDAERALDGKGGRA